VRGEADEIRVTDGDVRMMWGANKLNTSVASLDSVNEHENLE
jgi:hypothetical protein